MNAFWGFPIWCVCMCVEIYIDSDNKTWNALMEVFAEWQGNPEAWHTNSPWKGKALKERLLGKEPLCEWETSIAWKGMSGAEAWMKRHNVSGEWWVAGVMKC